MLTPSYLLKLASYTSPNTSVPRSAGLASEKTTGYRLPSVSHASLGPGGGSGSTLRVVSRLGGIGRSGGVHGVLGVPPGSPVVTSAAHWCTGEDTCLTSARTVANPSTLPSAGGTVR